MKTWVLLLSLLLVLGFTGFADACHKGKHAHAMHGIVSSVNGRIFTMTVGGKKTSAALMNVDASSASVTGTLAPAASVTVIGMEEGNNVTATKVTVSSARVHKAKPIA